MDLTFDVSQSDVTSPGAFENKPWGCAMDCSNCFPPFREHNYQSVVEGDYEYFNFIVS